MFRLENIEYLYALAAIPLFIVLFLVSSHWKKKMVKKFGESGIVMQLIPDVSTAKPVFKLILFSLAFIGVVGGIVNPQIGSKLMEVKRKGAEIIIAIDVSNSMKAEDLLPNRLQRAKQSISKLIDKLQGDKIGLIVFAGKAYVQLPVTTDYAAAKLFLETIDTDIVPQQGTSLSAAIDLATESFGKDEGKNKALIIITDGEDHEEGVLESVKKAAEKNIVIHTIGMGSPNGVPIPVYQGKTMTGYRKDKEGATIITKLNEQVLQEIASASQGLYIRASNSETGLNTLLDEIRKLDKKQIDSKIFADYDNKFPLFIWIALVLLLMEYFVSERKSKLYARLNLFGEKR